MKFFFGFFCLAFLSFQVSYSAGRGLYSVVERVGSVGRVTPSSTSLLVLPFSRKSIAYGRFLRNFSCSRSSFLPLADYEPSEQQATASQKSEVVSMLTKYQDLNKALGQVPLDDFDRALRIQNKIYAYIRFLQAEMNKYGIEFCPYKGTPKECVKGLSTAQICGMSGRIHEIRDLLEL